MAVAVATADGGAGARLFGVLVRRSLFDGRVRTLGFAYLFAAYSYIQPAGYASTYPTVRSRLAFAHSFGGNAALRLFYGQPHDLGSIDGYTAWRVGGTLAIAAAVWGVLAAIRATRAEEDSGRTELVLAGALTRRTLLVAALTAIAAGAAGLWLLTWLGFVIGGLPAGGGAYLALAIVSVTVPFVGVGALAAQLAPNRRTALALAGALVAASLLVRALADTGSGVGWLRWLSPLGWAEEMRPFAGPRPLALAVPLCAGLLLLWAALRIAERRDLSSGVIPVRDSAPPRLWLLSSPAAQTLRSEGAAITVWVVLVGVFAYILGAISKSVTNVGISKQVEHDVARLGVGSILTPKGYLSFCFLLFVFAVSLFACSQVGAAAGAEESHQVETLLALPVDRRAWLAGRLAVACLGAAGISIGSGLLAWAGAASQGVGVSFAQMLLAGLNCLPVALLTLAVAALAFALTPGRSAAAAYALVTLAFFWDLVASLVKAPRWLLEATPFAHVGLVPAAPLRGAAAGAMIGLAVLIGAAALALFARRDVAR